MQDLLQARGELGAGVAVSCEKVKWKPHNTLLPLRSWAAYFLSSCFWFWLSGTPAPLGKTSLLHSMAEPPWEPQSQPGKPQPYQEGSVVDIPRSSAWKGKRCLHGETAMSAWSMDNHLWLQHRALGTSPASFLEKVKNALRLASYIPTCKEDSSSIAHLLLTITGLHLGRLETSICCTASFLASSEEGSSAGWCNSTLHTLTVLRVKLYTGNPRK